MAKENKREQIITALERLMPGRRFHEITLDEVAHEAQVGKGTIYLYFKDKDALFAEMALFRLERLCGEFEKLSGKKPDELIPQIFTLIGDFIQRHHALFEAVSDLAAHVARLSPDFRERISDIGKQVSSTLAGVLQSSLGNLADREALVSANILLWLANGLRQAILNGQQDLPDPEELQQFFRRGIGLDKNN